jgi:dimethylglycine dehydrogenase
VPFHSACADHPRPRPQADLDYAHWTEAGIEPFVSLKREGARFLGRDAPPPAAPRRHAVYAVQTSAAHAWSVPGDSPVLSAAGEVVGFTTTSARGAITGQTIALGYVKCAEGGAPLAAPGAAGLTLECYGERWPVQMLERPPVAPGRPAPVQVEKVAAMG